MTEVPDRKNGTTEKTEETEKKDLEFLFRSLRWLRCSVFEIRCLDLPPLSRGAAELRGGADGEIRCALAIILVLCGTVSSGCGRREDPSLPVTTAFASDLAFIREHTRPLVLGESSGPQVVVAPEYQGRVMTSTTGGAEAPSFGWIGRTAIAARSRQPHMNVFGGEDRIWLGPEGGQYLAVLQAERPVRPRSLAGAGRVRLGCLGCRDPVRDVGAVP